MNRIKIVAHRRRRQERAEGQADATSSSPATRSSSRRGIFCMSDQFVLGLESASSSCRRRQCAASRRLPPGSPPPARRPPAPATHDGCRSAPARLREGALQAPLDGGHGVPARRRRRHRLHLHGDADLRGAGRGCSSKPESQNVVVVQAVLDEDQTQGRLLPDAVQHPAEPRAGAPHARRLKLWDTPPFGGDSRAGLQSQSGRSLGARRGWSPACSRRDTPAAAASRPAADETAAQSRAIDAFARNLTVAPIRNSRLVDVKYRLAGSRRWRRASSTRSRRTTSSRTSSTSSWRRRTRATGSEQRLAEQRKQVEEAEAKLQHYREQNDAISLEDRENIVVQKLADLNAAVTRPRPSGFRRRRCTGSCEALRGESGDARHVPGDPRQHLHPAAEDASWRSSSSQHAQLAEKLGDKHPEMVKLQVGDPERAGEAAAAKSRKVVQAVRNEYQAALAQENSLAAALNQQKARGAGDEPQGASTTACSSATWRAASSSTTACCSARRRPASAGELKTSNIRVVDRGRDGRARRSARSKALNLLLALFGGIAPGVRAGVLLRVPRQPHQDAGRARGAPRAAVTSALVPALDAKNWQDRRAARSATASRRTSPKRSGRSGPTCSSPPPRKARASLVVTSTGPGEGKTMVASNLAIGFAQAGPARAADRRRHAPAARARGLRPASRSRACRTCWWATPRPARRCRRRASPGCGCWPPAAFRRTRRSCSARSVSGTS